MATERPSDPHAATASGQTTMQWLIERGQPEGEQNAVWLEHTGMHPASEGRWTSNAWDAAMFPDKATAEAYIAERGLEARAVEHGFMHVPTREEKLEAVAAAAERYLAASNTLAFRPTKEVETAAAQAHHDLTEALNAVN